MEFVKPEDFTDAGHPHALVDRKANLESLRSHLVRQAEKLLPAGESLAIFVTDVDLAGAYEPTQRYSNEIRVVKDIYPPRIDLRFKLTRADGTVVKEGERTLRDPGFLMAPSRYLGDNLGYEKAMLDDWLHEELQAQRARR
ncbi:MAG TPA: DUF3016 domain-containing protein [Usitatibacter sp.]|nr:DUF3016 domain-containing protein [Usitatibacter sp.]